MAAMVANGRDNAYGLSRGVCGDGHAARQPRTAKPPGGLVGGRAIEEAKPMGEGYA
ncbi:hypothetical protein OV450_0584 [Actinobacteria bacterium OV450]|nr:hypothetical protein OV450_0584 [Actinobacteria bacterium OV450]